jgi:hypothetical protein
VPLAEQESLVLQVLLVQQDFKVDKVLPDPQAQLVVKV